MIRPKILIVGGSTRAAADSVRRAGGIPICADLYADQDLCWHARVIPVREYPESIADDVRDVEADAWFYCGGLENRPDLLERLLECHSYGPLLGTPPDTIRLVRNPLWLRRTLSAAGFPALDVVDQSSPPEADGTWMQKPLASAGGHGLRIWNAEAIATPHPEDHYFQRVAKGAPMSALFRIDAGIVHYCGALRELAGLESSLAPGRWFYCGSVGPVTLSPVLKAQLEGMMRAISQAADGLRGIVGLDFRWDGEFAAITEINPRYTASVEILELASGKSLLNPAIQSQDQQQVPVLAKQILYAQRQLVAPDLSEFADRNSPWHIVSAADLPWRGTTIQQNWPICTVFAAGQTFEQVETELKIRRQSIDERIQTANVPDKNEQTTAEARVGCHRGDRHERPSS